MRQLESRHILLFRILRDHCSFLTRRQVQRILTLPANSTNKQLAWLMAEKYLSRRYRADTFAHSQAPVYYLGRLGWQIVGNPMEDYKAYRLGVERRSELLSGLLKCGYCGSAMCKEGSWGGGYYVCGRYHQTRGCTLNSFRRIHLEAAVRDYLVRILKDEDIFENVRNSQRDGTVRNTKSEIARLQKQLADFPVRTTRLFDLYETGNISRPEFVRRRDQLTALEGQMRDSVVEKERLVQNLRSLQLTRDMFEQLRDRFDRLWDSSDPAERKHALWNLIDKITIKDKSFKIDFRVPELSPHSQTQSAGRSTLTKA